MDYIKLLGKMTGEEEDKKRLDAYLSSIAQKDPNSVVREEEMSLQPPPRKKPFEAEILRARQEASETPLGQLFGITPMSEEEKSFYDTNRDESVEQGMKMGQQFGMGMGGINNIAPKALQALKGAAFTGASKIAPASKAATSSTINADEVPEAIIQQMLQQRKAESMASAIARKEMEWEALSGKPMQDLGRELTNLKNRTYKVLDRDKK